MKSKPKSLYINLIITIFFSLVLSVCCYFDIFQKLDYRFYDSILKIKKEPPKTENILLVEIDDISIETLGEWPWSRDVIADALLRMKELEAKYAVFDIEYISPSKNGIAPSAQKKIDSSINSARTNVSDALLQVSDAISTGYYSNDELPNLTNEMITSVINPVFTELTDYIGSNISRDNDEYFAQCLQFFGNSYLTINHINLGYSPTLSEVEYINNRFLLQNVNDPLYRVNIDNDFNFLQTYESKTKGFTPALHKLITRAHGVGFTNSVVDSDGVRRRFELLSFQNNYYLAQLVFSPFLDLVDSTSLVRTNNTLIVKNALLPNSKERKDISIPLDNHGCVLVNYRKGNIYDSFNCEPIINLIYLDQYENQIVSCLNNIIIDASDFAFDDNGFELPAISECRFLIDLYSNISAEKEKMLANCTGFSKEGKSLDGITDEEYKQYFSSRQMFYRMLKDFVKKKYKDILIEKLLSLGQSENQEIITQLKAYLNEDFDVLEQTLKHYNESFSESKLKFKDAICIIGNTATSTTDIGATSLEKQYYNVGLHANLLNTILTQSFITYWPWYYGFTLCFVLSLLLIFFYKKSNTFQNIIGFVVIALAVVIFVLLFYYFNIYIPSVGCIIYLGITYLALFSYRFYVNSKEKNFITLIASSFANKVTVDELRKNPDAFKTGGEKKHITALFSDIQKFSTFSEKMDMLYGAEGPNKLIKVLNEYLGAMSNVILRNNGTIDKYEGDAIISMFGAPDPQNLYNKNEWAYFALDSAIKMKQVEKEFNNTYFDPEHPETSQIPNPLYTRVGLNSGDAFVGLMGSQTETFNKVNYTMIGDTVNLASRLEGVNKFYDTSIICSDSTWQLANSGLNEGKIIAKKLDKVRVVGKTIPIQLYNIIGFRNELSQNEIENVEYFNEAYKEFMNKNFLGAGKLFLQANAIFPQDKLSIFFAERCKKFIEKGVSENWDGIVDMTNK